MSKQGTTGAAGTTKKTVPNFLQKKKDQALGNMSQQTSPQNTLSNIQAVNTQKQMQKTKNTTSQVKDVNVQIEQKEQFPQLMKIREKDPRQLDVNMQKCKEVYDFYERKGRNELPARELGDALRSLGYLVSTKEIRELQEKLTKCINFLNQILYKLYFKHYFSKEGKPTNNQTVPIGIIEFKDFLAAVHVVQNKLPNEKELSSALQVFDKNNTQTVNKELLKGVLTKIGDIINENELESLLSGIYTDKNGNIPIQYILGTLLKYPKP